MLQFQPKARYRYFIELCLIVFMAYFLYKYYTPEHGFSRFLNFGYEHFERATNVTRSLPIKPISEEGYDGQLYFQIALDPSLADEELPDSVGNLKYRARRIGMPGLSYGLGLGNPHFIYYTYPLLNFIFWGILLYLIFHYLKIRKVQEMLCACAILVSTGTIESMRMALVDLPATVMAFVALILTGWGAGVGFSYALLTRETLVLSLFKFFPEKINLKTLLVYGLKAMIICLPLILWNAYLGSKLGHSGGGLSRLSESDKFGLPMVAMSERFLASWFELFDSFSGKRLFDVLAIMSYSVQAFYLLFFWKWKNPTWRWAVGFAVLFLFLGPLVWPDHRAPSRILLPMTFGFNMLLMNMDGRRKFMTLFLAGNIGCLFGVYEIMVWD